MASICKSTHAGSTLANLEHQWVRVEGPHALNRARQRATSQLAVLVARPTEPQPLTKPVTVESTWTFHVLKLRQVRVRTASILVPPSAHVWPKSRASATDVPQAVLPNFVHLSARSTIARRTTPAPAGCRHPETSCRSLAPSPFAKCDKNLEPTTSTRARLC